MCKCVYENLVHWRWFSHNCVTRVSVKHVKSMSVCWYFFLTLSRIVIVTFIQLTWLLFCLLIFLLLVFFTHTKFTRNTPWHTVYMYILRQPSHSLIFYHLFLLFQPQQKHMYTTHNCRSNNVMRFLMEPDCRSISLTCHKKQSIVSDLSPRPFFSLVICVSHFKCEC